MNQDWKYGYPILEIEILPLEPMLGISLINKDATLKNKDTGEEKDVLFLGLTIGLLFITINVQRMFK